MKNFQNFKILQIADNMWLLQILSKFVCFFSGSSTRWGLWINDCKYSIYVNCSLRNEFEAIFAVMNTIYYKQYLVTIGPEKISGLNRMWTHDLCDNSLVLSSTELTSQPGAGHYVGSWHNDQLSVGLLVQLVEHWTIITKVLGLNPVQAWIFPSPIFTTA